MSFKIDESLRQIGTRSQSSPAKLKVQANNDNDASLVEFSAGASLKEKSKSDLEAYNKPIAATGDRLDLSNIKKIAALVQNASSNLQAIAEERLFLAKTAENLPAVTDYGNDLDSANDTLYNEQERILSSQLPNGTSISSANTLTYDVKSKESYSSVSLPGISSAIRPSNDIDKSALASTAVDELEASLDAIQILNSASEKAINAINSFGSKNEIHNTDKNEERDTEEATLEIKQLAENVANQIGSAYHDEEASAELIEISTKDLDPERVKNLLA